MSGFCPVPAPHNTPSAAELPEQFPVSLSSCPMIFVRKDGNVPALALYAEPSKVLFGSQVPSPGLNESRCRFQYNVLNLPSPLMMRT